MSMALAAGSVPRTFSGLCWQQMIERQANNLLA
jgi:hypothetical protein